MTHFLRVVERLGNALPHPVTLFALFALFIVLLSGVLGWMEVSVPDPRPVGARGRADNGLIEVISLMNAEGVRMIVLNLVTNFTGFVPLGTVLVALLGVGVAERSGLLTALIRSIVLNASPKIVTVAIVFAGVISNTASEMGYVVLVKWATWSSFRLPQLSTCRSAGIRWRDSQPHSPACPVVTARICCWARLTPCWPVLPKKRHD
jgi:aminobenzoyl-glutamate transport protein